MNCRLPASSIHRISQARIPDQVAISFSSRIFLTQGSNQHLMFCRQILYHWATRECFESSYRWICGLVVKNPPANAGDPRDMGLMPGLGRSPGVGNGSPLQYSCLENSMDREAWRATVHVVAEGWIQLGWVTEHKYSQQLFFTKISLFMLACNEFIT